MKRRTKSTGRFRYGSVSLLLMAALTVFLIAVNISAGILEKKHGWRADCSFNGITTQSETTLNILKELKHPVHIYALFPKGEEDAPLMELLDRYAAASPLITWEQTDAAINPAVTARFSANGDTVSSDSLIVYCADTDRHRILTPADFISLSLNYETGVYEYAGYTYEQSITNAVCYVTREKIPRIAIVQGHGELDGDTLRTFDSLMTSNQYDVTYAELSDNSYTPDPADLLVFFSPLRDLSDAELEKLITFAGNGGSFLFTADYTDPLERMPNYCALLRSYGFIPKNGIVVADREDTDSYYNNVRIDLLPELRPTDMTGDLIASGADTLLMPGARAFETPEDTDRNLIVSEVIRSSEASYLKQVSAQMTTMDRADGDEAGPFTLALQARRITAEGNVSRAFITGCSALLTNEQVHAMTDSQQLLIRTVEFLLNTEASDLKIMARVAVRPALSAKSTALGSLLITALPLGILLAALLVLLPRRKR